MRAKLRWLLDLFISGVQVVCITICLMLIYYLVIGTMHVFALIFRPRLLGERAGDSTTYWTAAEAYQPDLDDCKRQS